MRDSDKFQNAATVSRKNTSKVIWKTELKGRAVVTALRDLLEDPGCCLSHRVTKILFRYAQRAERLAQLMSSKSFSPKDRILEAVEYTGKFGRIHDLDVHGFSMGTIEYFNIDVIIGWMFVFFCLFYSIHFLFYRTRVEVKEKYKFQ